MSVSGYGRGRARVMLAALLLVLVGGHAAAQTTTTIRGIVLESDGNPVADVTITLLPEQRRTVSGAGGEFFFSGVSPGPHRIALVRLGYTSVTQEVDVAVAGASVRIRLQPEAIAVTGVTVIGSPLELAENRAELRRVPGGVTLIEPRELRNTRLANLQDVLRFTPGVWTQARFGAADEAQLSIRGTALRNNFHLRGVNVLVNNMPYRNADGFTDFESLELATAHSIQVFKGANALRYGGSTLGGAVNLETKTGYTSERLSLIAESGYAGFLKAQLASGGVFGPWDYYASFAHTELDGQREHAEQRRERVNAHVGFALSSTFDARAFYFYANVREKLPGSLTAAELAADPEQAAPQNVTNDWGRDYHLHHFGAQLRGQLGEHARIDVAPYLQYRDIVHPIFRVIDQISRDFGTEVRLQTTQPLVGHDNAFTLGVQLAGGNIDNRNFDNVGGESGTLRKDQRDEAGTQALYIENVLDVGRGWSAVVGARYARDLRRVRDRFQNDGDQSGERWYEAFQPRLGVLYELSPEVQFFANASRMYEPPLLLEVNSLTQPGLVDLAAQEAWQLELGTRGTSGPWSWDVSAYDLEIDDELINVNVRPFAGATFTVPTYRNVPRTRHVGFESALTWSSGDLFTRARDGDDLVTRIAWTVGRYSFERDPAFAGNRLPGAPAHVVQAELAYRHPSGITVRPSVEWVPASYPIDSGNTVENDGWLVAHVRGELELPRWFASAFVELRNVGDTRYSPAVTVDDAAGRYYLPGEARSLYAGLRWRR